MHAPCSGDDVFTRIPGGVGEPEIASAGVVNEPLAVEVQQRVWKDLKGESDYEKCDFVSS
jgi:hypothetical protein